MIRSFIKFAACTALLAAVPAAAHHSAAMFDFRNTKTLTGVVEEFKVINPHSSFKMAIDDGKGTREWVFEGHSASNFYRAGYNRGAVKAGDTITVTVAPMRDGSDGGYIVSFVTAGGERVNMASTSPTGR